MLCPLHNRTFRMLIGAWIPMSCPDARLGVGFDSGDGGPAAGLAGL